MHKRSEIESLCRALGVTPEHRERLIREKAYELYLGRGCAEGHALDDWLSAENEVDWHLLAAKLSAVHGRHQDLASEVAPELWRAIKSARVHAPAHSIL